MIDFTQIGQNERLQENSVGTNLCVCMCGECVCEGKGKNMLRLYTENPIKEPR